MLIERKPNAVKMLSVRTDMEAFEALHALSESMSSSTSVLIRLAISDLLGKQKKVKAKNLAELMDNKENI